MHLHNNFISIKCATPGSVSILDTPDTVSVLGREEGYTMKYGLSPRKFPRAQPEGTS